MPQVDVEIAKRSADPFLHHRVVERHIERSVDSEPGLNRPCQEVGQVLDSRSEELGAELSARVRTPTLSRSPEPKLSVTK